MNTFQITIQRKSGDGWPVVVEESRGGVFLPVRKEGLLKIEEAEPLGQATPRDYGTVLGKALFRENIRDAFVQALRESEDCLRVLLFVEAPDLRTWRWERLCAPLDTTGVSERQLRTWFDEQLITPAGTRGVVYRDKEKTAGLPNEAVDYLVNLHIIRAELRRGATWYELAHDRLIGPIREANRRGRNSIRAR